MAASGGYKAPRWFCRALELGQTRNPKKEKKGIDAARDEVREPHTGGVRFNKTQAASEIHTSY